MMAQIQASFMSRRAALKGALAAAGTLGLGTVATAQEEATPAAGVSEGGRLRVAYEGAGSAENLNLLAFTAIDYMRQSHVNEPLARFVGEGQEMVLATAITPNEDGSVWTITLRPDVTWHDGSPFTAEDVVYTFAYNVDPNNGQFYMPLVGNINVEAIQIIDDLTIDVPLHAPANDLHLLIGGGEVLMLKKDFADRTTMMGTGPFRLVEFTAGVSSLLERNPDYWGYPERGPFVDELELLSISGATARANAVEAGQADIAPSITFVDAARLLDSPDLQVIQSEPPGVQPAVFVMRTQEGLFSDIRLRHAVKLATDRQALVDAALFGFGVIGNDLYGLGVADYNGAIPQREFDVEAAQALVTEAGAEGAEFAFQVTSGLVGNVEAATLLVDQLEAIGLHGTLEVLDQETYTSRLLSDSLEAPMVSGQGSGYGLSTTWQFIYTPGAPTNLAQWTDETWQANFALSRTTLDEDERTSLLDQLQEQLWDEGGDLVWGFTRSLLLAGKGIEGVTAAYYPLMQLVSFTADE